MCVGAEGFEPSGAHGRKSPSVAVCPWPGREAYRSLAVDLPVMPPVKPMLAKAMTWEQLQVLARERDYKYEPKWDGFRCIVYRDHDEVELGSRNGRPLTRYFPELLVAAQQHLPERCVFDGEVVVAGPAGLDFDVLSQRIHPAASRVELLSRRRRRRSWPSTCWPSGTETSCRRPSRPGGTSSRRPSSGPTRPSTSRPSPRTWRRQLTGSSRFEGAGLDGVVAKPVDVPYLPDQRAMVKVKHERTGDFVVAGFRWYQADPSVVGSLMLGLYDGRAPPRRRDRFLPGRQRRQLVGELQPYRDPTDHPWAAVVRLHGRGRRASTRER